MYAVIQAGGRQYKVSEGDTIKIDSLEAEVGSKVTFDQVLLAGGDSIKIGQPVLDGASVTAEVTSHGRDDKVIIFKKRRRKASQTTRGFRAQYTSVRIDSIKA
ncbi:MAG: 50S ribosomal protein L21 [Myxococcota bacterium]|nr:50S ribosomal protein L21 [Myxococcota bacterium]